jgi:nitroreductase
LKLEIEKYHEKENAMKRISVIFVFAAVLSLSIALTTTAEELKPIPLPAPHTEGGKPLMEALKARSTSRDFSDKELPLQVLSDLLWAAFGINRPDSGKRTAPSAMNWQEIEIYVTMKSGVFIYDAKANVLNPILAEDVRAKTGMQKFVADAPVTFVFVADFSKMSGVVKDDKILYSAADTGFISQNVYLFCASEGLVTGVRGLIDRPALSATLKLKKDQKIILAQSVGYPK